MSKKFIDKKVNYGYIDAIRGFAILAVLGIHVSQQCKNLPPFLFTAASLGYVGVQLFFVASAFTLSLSMKNRKSKENSPLRNYFIRRYFRIAPMYYFGILFYFVVRVIGKGVFPPEGYDFISVITNLTFLHGFSPYTFNYIVPGGWSIAAEFIFYAFFPIFFSLVKNYKGALILLFVTLVFSIAGFHFWDYVYGIDSNLHAFKFHVFTTQFPVFAIGILMFFVWQYREEFLRRIKINRYIVSIISLIIFSLIFYFGINFPNIPYSHLISPVVFSISFLFFGFALMLVEWKVFVNYFTIQIGKISYSLYINHFIFAWYIAPETMKFLSKSFHFSPSLYFILSYSITLIGASVFSIVTYNIIEKKGMNYGKKTIIKLEQKDYITDK